MASLPVESISCDSSPSVRVSVFAIPCIPRGMSKSSHLSPGMAKINQYEEEDQDKDNNKDNHNNNECLFFRVIYFLLLFFLSGIQVKNL